MPRRAAFWRRVAIALAVAGGMAPPLAADLLVSSAGSSKVVRVDVATGAASDFVSAGAGGLQSPDGMVFGPDGSLYVCNEQVSSVLRFDGASGASIDTFVAPGSGGLDVAELPVFGLDGNLYVSSLRGDKVVRYDGVTGAYLDTFVPVGSGGLDAPSGMVFGPDGDLYVSSTDSDQVLRYDGSSGVFRGAFVTAGSGGLDEPVGLAFGPDGNLYVSSLATQQVLRYDGSTGAFLDAFVPAHRGGLSSPYGLTFGSDGDLYVVGITNARVFRYRGSDGAFVGELATHGLVLPTYLVFTPDQAPCQTDATHLCLAGGRFRVQASWRTGSGRAGTAQAARLTAASGTFSFFDATNVELVVKVLDGCAVDGSFWVFAAGLTDVEVTLTVTDVRAGGVRTYHSPAGTPFAPIEDTLAFPACP